MRFKKYMWKIVGIANLAAYAVSVTCVAAYLTGKGTPLRTSVLAAAALMSFINLPLLIKVGIWMRK